MMIGRMVRALSGAFGAAALLMSAGAAHADGDISGTWWIKYYRGAIAPDSGDPVPFTKKGREEYLAYGKGRLEGTIKDDTSTYCLPDGVVRASGSPLPFEIIQVGTQVFILYEEDRTIRVVNLGGERVPEDERNWTFMGESIGRWDGETLVIETLGENPRTKLDQVGIPHGERLKSTERIRRLADGKTLESVITIEDPEYFTKPWTVRYLYLARPEVQIREYVCGEPHRDATAVLQGRQDLDPPTAGLPPLTPKVSSIDWKSPNPAMTRSWQRAPWRSTKQKEGALGRNDGNGEVPSVMEGWDDRDEKLNPKALQLMKAYDAAVTAGVPAPTTSSSCDFDGWPAIIGLPNQWQIVATPDTTYILYAYNSQVRRIHMNVPHPDNAPPSWMGYSTGRWEGDTLVVFTSGLNDKGTLNWDGIPRSTRLRVTERYTLQPDGLLRADLTLEDPKVIKGKTWLSTSHYRPVEGLDENRCAEGNRDDDVPKE